jgi:hypothetical protein
VSASKEIRCGDCRQGDWCLPEQVRHQLTGGKIAEFICALEPKRGEVSGTDERGEAGNSRQTGKPGGGSVGR